MLKDQKTHHDVGVDDTGVVADGLEKQEFVAHSFDDDVVDQTSSLHGRVGRVVYRHHATRLAELTHVLQLQAGMEWQLGIKGGVVQVYLKIEVVQR